MIYMVWISLSARVLVNVEALNMVEAIGNYMRHRRAPVVFLEERTDEKTGEKIGIYTLRHVVAVSGEAIAHSYQKHLAQIAKRDGLSVCAYCLQEDFIKRGVDKHLEEDNIRKPENKPEDLHRFEKEVIAKCVVEDVGGFLYPGPPPVRRTSCVQFSYLLPSLEELKATTVEPQFHTRLSREGQMIYYVETGSAVYVISVALDASRIGRTSFIKREDAIPFDERIKRIKAALNALYLVVVQGKFGAKQSRFMPEYHVLSMVIAVSRDLPFNVKSSHRRNYIVDTVNCAKYFMELTNSPVKVVGYIDEYDRRVGVSSPEKADFYIEASSPDEAFHYLHNIVLEEFRQNL